MKQEYIITENLDDRPTYKGQRLTVAEILSNNYYELVDKEGNRFLAGEEEIEKAPPQPPQEEMMKGVMSRGSNFGGKCFLKLNGENIAEIKEATGEEIIARWNGWEALQDQNRELKEALREVVGKLQTFALTSVFDEEDKEALKFGYKILNTYSK